MERSPSEIRISLAQGHWALGEYDDAIFCLERVADEDPGATSLLDLADSFLSELGGQTDQGQRSGRLNQVRARVRAHSGAPSGEASGLATSTLAELHARQGHPERALAVAEDVLRRNPEDARARSLRGRLLAEADPGAGRTRHEQLSELERWLEALRRRQSQPRQGRA